MKKTLYNYCLRNGGRVDFGKPLDLKGWENYHLKSLYTNLDELFLISEIDGNLPWINGNTQDIIWSGVCDEYQEAVYNAVIATMDIDTNLF